VAERVAGRKQARCSASPAGLTGAASGLVVGALAIEPAQQGGPHMPATPLKPVAVTGADYTGAQQINPRGTRVKQESFATCPVLLTSFPAVSIIVESLEKGPFRE